MSNKFSKMLLELGIDAPAGRERFFNRPMPTTSSQLGPTSGAPDTEVTSGIPASDEECPSGEDCSDDQMPFQLDDETVVIMSASALKKLITASGDDEEKLGMDDLPDEDELFGDPDGPIREPKDGGLGSLNSEEEGKLSSEEEGGEDDTGMQGADGLGGISSAESEEEANPNKAGAIRQVKGAKLTFKRMMPDGTFSEMWVYNLGQNLQNTLDVKRAILSGTDIPENKFESVDGKQRYQIVTMGNAQILKIEGLPN